MQDLRHTYAHYGDRLRRRRKIRATLIFLGFSVAALTAAQDWRPSPALAAGEELLDSGGGHWFAGENAERWNQVFKYARRFKISNDLAAAIYEEAVEQRIDPELAFRVVRLESRFQERALSPVGAIGLTQLMPATARIYQPGISLEEMNDRHTNLRIGFSYLRDLLEEYRDVRVALLVYNRGPLAVVLEREMGIDPSNGYDHIVLKGYRGTGLLKERQAKS
ncbi:MAG TPA: transglycosylase SLT domain-containing protein [Gemmatimonadaceae bacterium]|nr:transglycosylase SLT domain-containing protein [Gemmatimonadaceae bacterium]